MTSTKHHSMALQHQNALMWFRQDLRLADNQALTAACDWARENGTVLKAIYIATPTQWQHHDVAPIQLDFIERHINLLAQGLASLGVAFELIQLDTFADVQSFMLDYCQQHSVTRVFAGKEPEINEQLRDQACIESGIPLVLTDEHCLLASGSVLNLSGGMYKVFTPFSRKWREIAASKAILPLAVPAPLGPVINEPPQLTFINTLKLSSELWAAGEGQAKRLLSEFIQQKVQDYKQDRDFPAIDGTSSISPYLAIGVLSSRQCVAALLHHFPEVIVDDTSPARTWLNELIWREFYRHLLVAFPDLSKNHNFNRQADKVQWRNNLDEFTAWCEGQTGYPIVDAAMRQLNQTGWMHNRLRMVVASFLTKHLLIDWRWGERYFRQKLIDGDLAANNGGWQWSAGCGCDAQPYFRIFNPISQSEKFDPDGSFIRKYLPELASWGIKQLHQPSAAKTPSLFEAPLFNTQTAYPSAIVDHSTARVRALTVLGVLKKAAIT
ncbi:deoxyribodipyrimidine photo-lyase [Shewanella glacialipiscicola]|uniref:deoxyribodipyrimidine photo-lyase n=1 Tax=Shewanella glacialipiscicola TaxID=614069 RepID=UPI0021DA4D03|nr:deoxyribodipyrimidine photo-lyase [Shewanella glacialipiscicola]MCU7993975.1 deoxyribodipyrimidine photo-lyase [Shewanella glacialipiscicola]MCU8025293.1 deoxyribodipyrimidine photo-lyase [Shewanella glacialipiscicola]